MSDKFQQKYRIPSARATFHNYDGGAYFVTICTEEMKHFFGEISNMEMKYTIISFLQRKLKKLKTQNNIRSTTTD